jgi:hypothetical protein
VPQDFARCRVTESAGRSNNHGQTPGRVALPRHLLLFQRTSFSLRCPGLLGLCAAGDSIKDGQSRLLYRRYSNIDGNACFPLQPVGATLIMSHICLTLRLGNDPFQRVNIGGNFRSYRGPVLNGCVASGLNFSFHLFGCLRGCSMCFLFAVSIFSCTSFEAAAIASSAFLARTELVLPLCGSRFSQCTSFEAAAIASSAFLARTERSASCCDSG